MLQSSSFSHPYNLLLLLEAELCNAILSVNLMDCQLILPPSVWCHCDTTSLLHRHQATPPRLPADGNVTIIPSSLPGSTYCLNSVYGTYPQCQPTIHTCPAQSSFVAAFVGGSSSWGGRACGDVPCGHHKDQNAGPCTPRPAGKATLSQSVERNPGL